MHDIDTASPSAGLSTNDTRRPAQARPGTLYGIGVGPGAPDLLTLRAVSLLRSVDVAIAAASPKNDHSLALSIAEPHLPDAVEILRLDFPMTRDPAALAAAWQANAQKTAEVLRSGKNAAFLTLGDPLIYSTFGYLMRTLQRRYPNLPVEVVPGITSFQEAAAKTRTVLCEDEESLLIAAGITSSDMLAQALAHADSSVIMKVYKNSEAVYDTLKRANKAEDSLFVSRIGLEQEQIVRGLAHAPEKPPYLSLILSPPEKKRQRRNQG